MTLFPMEIGCYDGMRIVKSISASGITYSLHRASLVDQAVRQRLSAIADGWELDQCAPNARMSLVRLAVHWTCHTWAGA